MLGEVSVRITGFLGYNRAMGIRRALFCAAFFGLPGVAFSSPFLGWGGAGKSQKNRASGRCGVGGVGAQGRYPVFFAFSQTSVFRPR